MQLAVAHMLAMFGAFMAGILIYSYSAEMSNTSANGPRTWLVSCLWGMLVLCGTVL